MQITEVRIKLMDDSSERLQAFCSITFDDCFVVRDLKIIEGASGPFVAMPSRKLTSHCPNCGCKNHLRAPYCNQCGSRLKDDRAIKDADGRAKLYADIAHPINSACREMIQNRVIEEFQLEQERAQQPGYVSRYDDFDIDIDDASPRSSKPEPSAKDSESSSRPEQTHIEGAHSPGAPHTPASSPKPSGSQPSDPGGSSTPHTKPHTPDSSLSGPHTGSTRKSSESEEGSKKGKAGGESSSAGASLPPDNPSQKSGGSEFGAGIF